MSTRQRRKAEPEAKPPFKPQCGKNNTALDDLLEGCQIIGHDWRYLYLNDAAEKHNRRPKEELLGRIYMDMWPGIENTEVFAVIRRCMEKRIAHQMENEFVFPDGTIGWFELRIEPVPDGVFILSIDISERKKDEQRIKYLNTALLALRNINQLITREKNRERLMKKSCDLMVENRSFLFAWILLLDERGRFDSAFGAGNEKTKNTLLKQLGHGNFPPCVDRILKQEAPFALCETIMGEGQDCLFGQSLSGGKGFIIRLEYEQKVYGVISTYVPLTMVNDEEEQSLFQELAGDIAYALASMEKVKERERLNEELRLSEERYSDLFNNTSDMIQSVAPDGRFLYTNKAWRDKLGYSEGEIVNLMIWDIVHPDSMNHCMQTFGKVISGENVSDIQAVFVARDGKPITVEGSAHCRFVDDKPVSTQGIFRDVTLRKQAESALMESEEKCKAIFDFAVDGILLADPETRKFFTGNKAICRMLGYTQAEIESIGLMDIHPVEEVPQIIEKFEMQTREEATLILDIPVKRKDGSVFYADVNSSPVVFGGKTYLMGMFRDATARRKVEEEIRKLSSAVEHGPAIVMITDTKGNIEYVNPRFSQTTGYDSQEVVGLHVAALGIQSPEEMQQMWNMLNNGQEWHGEFPNIKKNGDLYWEEAAIAPVKDRKGSLSHFVKVAEDITKRKEADNKIRKLYSFQTAIRAVNECLIRLKDESELYQMICEILSRVDLVKFCWIGLVEEGTFEIKPVAQACLGNGYLQSIKVTWDDSELGNGAASMAIKTGQPFLIRDFQKYDKKPWQEEARRRGFASGLALPIMHQGETIGALTIISDTRDAFLDEEVSFLTEVVNDIALGVKSQRMEKDLEKSYFKVQRMLDSTVQALASVAEKRDPYTAGHQRRVSQLACAIAGELGLAAEETNEIRTAALLHDIGKISVPAEILSKPGKLTEVEFSIIRAHPQSGYEIIKTTEFPDCVAQMILQHQERMDGSGYPQGLGGEDIILGARILAVADVVEAMVSHRPYRPALGIGAALEEISNNKSRLYDSEVVDACLKLFKEKDFKLDPQYNA